MLGPPYVVKTCCLLHLDACNIERECVKVAKLGTMRKKRNSTAEKPAETHPTLASPLYLWTPICYLQRNCLS